MTCADGGVLPTLAEFGRIALPLTAAAAYLHGHRLTLMKTMEAAAGIEDFEPGQGLPEYALKTFSNGFSAAHAPVWSTAEVGRFLEAFLSEHGV